MGDYLHGFMTGLSNALRSKRRQVIEMKLTKVSPFNLGMLIALYERAVAAYAELIHINAFHQPGVQAYKLASKGIIQMLTDLESKLPGIAPFTGTAGEITAKLGMTEEYEVEGILAKLAANGPRRSLPVNLRRSWNKDKGWEYTVSAK